MVIRVLLVGNEHNGEDCVFPITIKVMTVLTKEMNTMKFTVHLLDNKHHDTNHTVCGK